VGQEAFKYVHIFNEKLVCLVDEIFWYVSSKSTEHAEKVLSSIVD
jgi:hypothetical protein